MDFPTGKEKKGFFDGFTAKFRDVSRDVSQRFLPRSRTKEKTWWNLVLDFFLPQSFMMFHSMFRRKKYSCIRGFFTTKLLYLTIFSFL